ncbi:hypothetical protein GCM10011391_28410 [Pullulanibacillus camelliae]|uniref:Uncharacterized protein n=1 Tax=Pullulanibacillus camelliae TaxID=1707096 RepID=A0A8J3DXF3_9BACL|nr:hypothetical protein [Pullulanibacillus camelliae]GGE47951.1 hypothetical protein GCM10011391_28410 [Pullulanibacillus camelliae]
MQQTIENPMVLAPIPESKVIDNCACGCGEEIVEGYEYIYMDGYWFADYPCLMRYIGADWRGA